MLRTSGPLVALVVALVAGALPGAGSGARLHAQAMPPPEVPGAERDPSRALTVGVPIDTYPFSFVEGEGPPQGFVVDLLAAIGKTMSLRLERVTGTTAEINGAFERGDLDLLQTYADSPAREAHADFSVPYLTLAGSIFVRRDLEGITRLEDLRGRRVLVHPGSLGEQVLRAAGLGDSVVHAESVMRAFDGVEAGEADATLATRLSGEMAILRRGLRNVVATGEPVPGYQVRYCFAVRDGDRALLARINEGLAIIERTGEADAIYNRWFGPVEPRRYTPLEIALAIAAGLAVALAVAVWSIVRQRALAERLRRQEAQLHRAQKLEAIGTLSSGIAHDFNNILTTIIGNAELLRAELPPASLQRDSAQDILEAAERARQLVAQVLTFSRPQDTRRVVAAILPVVQEAMRFLRATTPTAIEIVVAPGGDELRADVDVTQLHQALINVGTNAVYAMREGTGRLDVSVRRVTLDPAAATRVHVQPGAYVCITLRDTGRGIPADILPRIFDPFFTTKPQGDGTGLGLAVVLGILSAHQGGVTVTSAPGVGTEVRLFVPETQREVQPAAREGDLPHGAGRRVLLVDDEVAITRSVSRLLERIGYAVTSFTDAAEALDTFTARPEAFDAVLTDLTMPQLSGLDIARRVQTARPGVPVVLMSGFLGDAERLRAERAGVRRTVDKPLDMAVLARTLADCFADG